MTSWDRRDILGLASSSAMLGGLPTLARAVKYPMTVAIVSSPEDRIAASGPAQWAISQLAEALHERGVAIVSSEAPRSARGFRIVVAGFDQSVAQAAFRANEAGPVAEAEATALLPVKDEIGTAVLVAGHDARGLVYAVLDLADRVRNSADPFAALHVTAPLIEQPTNRVRSITRLFVSKVEDLSWYHDRDMWRAYLTMLATQRFNRFNLAFGIGYDFIRQVTDAYFLFAYPFLVSVPGYSVRVPQLPDEERTRNLETLRFISEEATARGLEFQIGLWMHGYVWIDSPDANYTIEGLNAQTHGPYCRDALKLLLTSCPAISGVTMRIHGESGVPEGDFSFWKTVFDGFDCGRPVRIDMHPKGMSQNMLDIALATGQQVTVSPKYWAEHLGMPYHQADIREIERPKTGDPKNALMSLSAGSRSFLRYGYGDLLREDRKWSVVHRVWPGTQRVLIWGDPETAAAHARAFTFCGSDGVEICEPLSFKGRRGSGHPGGRCGYADAALNPRWDWEKYCYTYRVWGRLLYSPTTTPEVWQRDLNARFGAAGPHIQTALGNASRILPIITTAHAPSAANNGYWPEMYFNQSMVDGEHYGPYQDTPRPRVFGHVSPLDPELFMSIDEATDEMLTGQTSGRYSPLEVAQWIEDHAASGTAALARADAAVRRKNDPDYRRTAIDIALQCGLGKFFGAKLRAGLCFALFEKTGDRRAIEQAVTLYRKAREAWAEVAERANGIYVPDLTVGEEPQLRGHWMDRLPDIDRDIAAVEQLSLAAKQGAGEIRTVKAIDRITSRPIRKTPLARDGSDRVFSGGQPLALTIATSEPMRTIKLRYRHVDQAERFETAEAVQDGDIFRATIPASYTTTEYSIEYFWIVEPTIGSVTIMPGFDSSHSNQPYHVARRA
jgi:hypothetical protein